MKRAESWERGAGVPFLMFHGIDSESEPSELTAPGDLVYVLDEKEFETCLDFLGSEGYRAVRLRDFLKWQKGEMDLSHRSVVITFDDGHASNVTKALPILVRKGFVAEFFITTGFVGTPNHVTVDDLIRLKDAGMGIGSHSVTHPMLNDLSDSEADRELRESRVFLEGITGIEVVGFSAPGGRTKDAVPGLAKRAGYDAVLTSSPGTNGRGADPYRLRRIPVKRGEVISRGLLERGYAGTRERILKSLYDMGKKGLGNERYEKLRERLLRKREGTTRSET